MFEEFRIKVFMAVAQEKSFTKAAALMGITQPAVSQNVAEIEKGLGVKCFERLKGETVLTPEGEVFMDYAKKFLALSEETSNVFAKLPPTVVRISASEELYTYLIAPSLETFSRIHPQVSFERAIFDNADLTLSLRPSTGSPYDIPADSIAVSSTSICTFSARAGTPA